MMKLFSILLLGTLFLTSCGRLSNSIWTPTPAAPGGMVRVANLGPFTPGTFEGSCLYGYIGEIRVAVTFDATRITALEVTYCRETPVFANPAYDALIPRVLQSQTYLVDIFTGATVTSESFLAAVRDAILQAGGREDDGGAAPSVHGPFTPGTFEGVCPDGYIGEIRVAVTFDARTITALEVTYHRETPVFANPAFAALIPSVLQAQTYQVDIFTGATVTSDSFLAAIRDAIRQATE